MAAADTAGTSFSDSVSASFDADSDDLPPGVGPWKLAWRRLRRNKVALFFGFIFLLIVIICLLAPVYSHDIAHISPNAQPGLTATVKVGGKTKDVVSATGIPILSRPDSTRLRSTTLKASSTRPRRSTRR